MRELHTTHFTIHKIQSGKKLVLCLCVGGSETPKNRGRNRRVGKKAKKKKKTKKKKECFRHTHMYVMMTNRVAVVWGKVGGSGNATQRNQTAKLNDGKFLFSFLFSCFGHPTISSLSHWTCVRQTSAMTHVNSNTKLNNPVLLRPK